MIALLPGMRAAVLNPPAGYLAKLEPLLAGVRILARPSREVDFVQVFARDVADLKRHGARALRSAKPEGVVWVAYPKGGKTKAMTDLPASPWWVRRDVLGELTGEKGYRVAGLAKIDETWTTLLFRKTAR